MRQLDQVAAVGQDERVHREAERPDLVAAEHLDRDREPHVVPHDPRPLDAEGAHDLPCASALIEQRVGHVAGGLVGEPKAQLVEHRDPKAVGQVRQRGREVVAARGEAVHENEIRTGSLLHGEDPVPLGQGHEATPPPPGLLHGSNVVGDRARVGHDAGRR